MFHGRGFLFMLSRDPCAVYLYYNRGTNDTPKIESVEDPIPPFTWIGILMYVYICLIYIAVPCKKLIKHLLRCEKKFYKIFL